MSSQTLVQPSSAFTEPQLLELMSSQNLVQSPSAFTDLIGGDDGDDGGDDKPIFPAPPKKEANPAMKSSPPELVDLTSDHNIHASPVTLKVEETAIIDLVSSPRFFEQALLTISGRQGRHYSRMHRPHF